MDNLHGTDNLGERLRILLKEARYTQKQAKDELGLGKNDIQNYFNGTIPKTKNLQGLSKIVGVSMEYLLTGDEKAKYISDEESQLIQAFRTLNENQQKEVSCFLAGITNVVDSLGKRLQLLLVSRGYTQKEVTDELGLATNTISSYVNRRTPEPEVFYPLSIFFEASMEWFLTGDVEIKGLSEEENLFIQRYRTLGLKEQGKIIGILMGLQM